MPPSTTSPSDEPDREGDPVDDRDEVDDRDDCDDRDDLDDFDDGRSTDAGGKPAGAVLIAQRRRSRTKKASIQKWARILHAYSSMLCLLVVLFFSVTGLTLNHPNWTLGGHTNNVKEAGSLPTASVSGTTVDWLTVAEYLRSTNSLRGEVSDHQASGGQGSITFKGPGYLANASFALDSRAYQLEIESQGYVGILNDLHKGRDTRTSWKWLIDASAIFLVFISLSGLVLQLVLKARRRSALWSAGGGAGLVAVLVVVATR